MMFEEKDVFTHIQGVSFERLHVWIERGWIKPANGEKGLMYSDLDLARVRLIRELRDDIEVHAEVVPIILSLIDQVYGLRWQMRSLVKAIDSQPDSVKKKIKKLLSDTDRD